MMRLLFLTMLLALVALGSATVSRAQSELQPGATMTAWTGGRDVELRLTAIEEKGAYALYTFEGPQGPLCGIRDGRPVPAVPLSGSWDAQTDWHPDGLTLACIDGAIGKCVTWGYRPWEPGMRDYHQACIRMVRADYCGTGAGQTRDGTPIDIWDDRGINRRDGVPGMTFEAAWGPDGAYAIRRTRYPAGMNHVTRNCPDRMTPSGRAEAVLFNASYPDVVR